jgi:hypothetical protein
MSLDMPCQKENAVILRCFDPVWGRSAFAKHGLFKQCVDSIYIDLAGVYSSAVKFTNSTDLNIWCIAIIAVFCSLSEIIYRTLVQAK